MFGLFFLLFCSINTEFQVKTLIENRKINRFSLFIFSFKINKETGTLKLYQTNHK